MPKCATNEIRAELAALKQGGFRCAVYYLEAELRRRDRSAVNRGRPCLADSETRKAWRERKARQRASKREEMDNVGLSTGISREVD
jgi:hypothetical protein